MKGAVLGLTACVIPNLHTKIISLPRIKYLQDKLAGKMEYYL
jgi:hypothetical protein